MGQRIGAPRDHERHDDRGRHPAPPQVREAGRKAAVFCREQGADISELALRFALRYPFVSSTLVGIATAEKTLRRSWSRPEVVPIQTVPSLSINRSTATLELSPWLTVNASASAVLSGSPTLYRSIFLKR